ncbi:glycosyltransferase family 25 protein [Rhodovulum sp. DZ06]|uniref:glycosyltransferase family 25 protein n=1 Tax=Rhodovulum sp. DZ06 TaxID=3425126 RepID=UPI003D3272C7
MTVPVLFINRDSDATRREAFLDSCFENAVAARRIQALDRLDSAALAAESRLLPDSFWESPEIKPGAFACFLSHRRAWEAVAFGDAPWALVCEDDALLEASERVISAHAGQAARMDLDLVWCGARACTQRDSLRPMAAGGFSDAVEFAADRAAGPPRDGGRAPGAEALLVSRRGAHRMLALTEADRCCAGVDWLLLYHCWDGRGAAPVAPEMAGLARMLGLGAPALRAAVAPEPLARISGAPSVLRHREALPIARLAGTA